ncbi:MAG: hypothetical protein HY481_01365 [Candidatus Vogelbacteria bacterium]|nr:hypothetical protein [Candidatus Vogelbacteria bacterium]
MINNFKDLVKKITENVFNPLVGLLLALALVYFLWGVFKYIQSAGDETKRKEGVSMMTYGIIALFVMVSVWGLVNLLSRTFPLGSTPPRPVPASPSSMTNPLPGLGHRG